MTGVAAVVRASLREAGLPVLTSQMMRAVLAGCGTPDGSQLTEPIGPRPNLRSAYAVVTRPDVPFITGIRYAKKKDRLVVDGLYLAGRSAPPEQRSLVFIDDVPVATQYPEGFDWVDGSTTRLTATGVSDLLPRKTIVYITVGSGDEVRSPRRARGPKVAS